MWPTTQRPAAAVPRPDITRLYRPRQLRREAGEGAGHETTIVTESGHTFTRGSVIYPIQINNNLNVQLFCGYSDRCKSMTFIVLAVGRG